MQKIFLNKNFVRDYETTNVLYCTTDNGNAPDVKGNWLEVDEIPWQHMAGTVPALLYIEGNTRVLGYL